MTDPLERIRSISLSRDDLHREMLNVAEAINRASEGHDGECRYSLSKDDPLRLRAILEHAVAGRLELGTLSEDADVVVVRHGSTLGHWWAEQLANATGIALDPFPGVSLQDGELAILRALRRSTHKTTLPEHLASHTGIVRKTVGEYLARLRSLNFVCCPVGEHAGTSLTEAGRHFLDARDAG